MIDYFTLYEPSIIKWVCICALHYQTVKKKHLSIRILVASSLPICYYNLQWVKANRYRNTIGNLLLRYMVSFALLQICEGDNTPCLFRHSGVSRSQ